MFGTLRVVQRFPDEAYMRLRTMNGTLKTARHAKKQNKIALKVLFYEFIFLTRALH